MKIKVANMKRLKNGSYIFSIVVDDILFINYFRLVPKFSGDYFLSLPQRKDGLKFVNTVLVTKELRDEIFKASLIELEKYKNIKKTSIEIESF